MIGLHVLLPFRYVEWHILFFGCSTRAAGLQNMLKNYSDRMRMRSPVTRMHVIYYAVCHMLTVRKTYCMLFLIVNRWHFLNLSFVIDSNCQPVWFLHIPMPEFRLRLMNNYHRFLTTSLHRFHFVGIEFKWCGSSTVCIFKTPSGEIAIERITYSLDSSLSKVWQT